MADSDNSVIILAIESSCDDTSAAIIKNGSVLSNIIANQVVHQKYGGVVPELASRQHHLQIVPVIDAAIKEAGVSKANLSAVAFTQGPGLLGSLIVGCSFAKGLALSLDKPLIAVNHMEAHVLAHFVEDPRPSFPFLCLTVSGGHTQIVRVESVHQMKVLGTTRDDAAGEAFDKIGKYMGLDYPAGPIIDRLASQGKPVFTFNKPRIDGLGFSFSGLKTSVLYFLRDELKKDKHFITNNLNDLCASVQKTIVEILMDKLIKASKQEHIHHIGIAGGVSANSALRASLLKHADIHGWQTYIPAIQYCTDNAGMIAMAAHYKYQQEVFVGQDATPEPRMKMDTI